MAPYDDIDLSQASPKLIRFIRAAMAVESAWWSLHAEGVEPVGFVNTSHFAWSTWQEWVRKIGSDDGDLFAALQGLSREISEHRKDAA